MKYCFFSAGYRHHVYFGMEGTLMPERIGANSLTSKNELIYKDWGVAVQSINKKAQNCLSTYQGQFFLALQH